VLRERRPRNGNIPPVILHPYTGAVYYQEQIPAIGSDGTIYAGGSRGIYALRPDGTQKWYYENVYQPSGTPSTLC
jgi:outer membrane protein assembly factor BamB